jgi:uncharacterized membrane protein YgcG
MIISSEKTATEVSWSHGVVIPTEVVTQAFGYQPKGGAYGAPAPAFGGGSVPTTGISSGLVVVIILIVILVLMMAACGSCLSDGGGSGSSSSGGFRGVGGSSSGGFGGK